MKKRLYTEHYTYNDKAIMLSDEIREALKPIIDKYAEEYDFIDIKNIIHDHVDHIMIYKRAAFSVKKKIADKRSKE